MRHLFNGVIFECKSQRKRGKGNRGENASKRTVRSESIHIANEPAHTHKQKVEKEKRKDKSLRQRYQTNISLAT